MVRMGIDRGRKRRKAKLNYKVRNDWEDVFPFGGGYLTHSVRSDPRCVGRAPRTGDVEEAR